MTLTTKLSALTIAGIMVVIGAPMVTQSAMASGRAPAPVAATTQPKLVTGDITSTDQSGTNLFFGKKIVRNARGAIMKVDRTWPAAVPAPLPDVRADSSTRMLLGPVVDLAVNEHPEGVFYRIPALATASNGDLLASYDLRPGSAGDAPNPNSIVQRRSRDNGRTWGPQTVIHAGTPGRRKVGYSDPSYLVDPATGRILNFHVKSYDRGFATSEVGTDPDDRHVLHAEVSTSTDNGHTWTYRDITREITPDPTTRTRFVASGQGIALLHGPHAGRLIAQMTVRNSVGQQAQSIYSDDHGITWHAGNPVGRMMDENKVVELSDGTLMLNSRDAARSGRRKVAYSQDGGLTWGPVKLVDDLIDPTNNAQIIRAYPNARAGSAKARILLFTNARNATERVNGTLSVSCDDGRTWVSHQTYMPGEVGYTTAAVQSDGALGVLWERDGIRYSTIPMGWLNSVCPLAPSGRPTSGKPTSGTSLPPTATPSGSLHGGASSRPTSLPHTGD